MPGIMSEGATTGFVPRCAAHQGSRSPVLERDDLDRRRDGEDDVVVGYLEQFRLAVRQPLGSCEALALRTVPVSARIVGHALMAAIAATLDVTAKGRGTATLDRGTRPPR